MAQWRLNRDQRALRASPLFDEHYYLASNPDVAASKIDPVRHYLTHGWLEGRNPSAQFDGNAYLAANQDIWAIKQNPLLHWLQHGQKEGRISCAVGSSSYSAFVRKTLVARSSYFDPDFYAASYPHVKSQTDDLLEHYMTQGYRMGYSPSAEFDLDAYLASNLDIAAANVEPVSHFLRYGAREGRAPPPVKMGRKELDESVKRIRHSGRFNDAYYRQQCPVIDDTGIDPILHYVVSGHKAFLEPTPESSMKDYLLATPSVRRYGHNPLLHYLDVHVEGESSSDPCDESRPPPRPGASFLPMDEYQAEIMTMIADCYRLRFECAASQSIKEIILKELAGRPPTFCSLDRKPHATIIIHIRDNVPLVLGCLKAIAALESRSSLEVLLIGPSENMHGLDSVKWIRCRAAPARPEMAVDDAVRHSRGKYVVFLDPRVTVLRGWLDELIETFELFPNVALVTSKIIDTNQRVVNETSRPAFGGNENNDPNHPSNCFAKTVGTSSTLVAAVLHEHLDTLTILETGDILSGQRLLSTAGDTILQPRSLGVFQDFEAQARANFIALRPDQMKSLSSAVETRNAFRTRQSTPKRMLVTDELTPAPERDSGSVITEHMMAAYQKLGLTLSFFPASDPSYSPKYSAALQKRGIECLYAPYFPDIRSVISNRSSVDYLLAFRYSVMERCQSLVHSHSPLTRLILHTVDLHHLREFRRAEVESDPNLKLNATLIRSREMEMIARADCTIVHTPFEQAIVQREIASDNLVVFPYIAKSIHSHESFEARRHIMFLGNFRHTPNVDAIVYFVQSIWPTVKTALPDDACLLVVGSAPNDVVYALKAERIIILADVPELEPIFRQARVSVVPLRYGAGIKGKLIQSLAHGVPAVATTIAAEGIGLEAGIHCSIVDSPDEFAEAVKTIYGSKEQWETMKQAGYKFVEENFSWDRCINTCRQILQVSDSTWLARAEVRHKAKLQSDV